MNPQPIGMILVTGYIDVMAEARRGQANRDSCERCKR